MKVLIFLLLSSIAFSSYSLDRKIAFSKSIAEAKEIAKKDYILAINYLINLEPDIAQENTKTKVEFYDILSLFLQKNNQLAESIKYIDKALNIIGESYTKESSKLLDRKGLSMILSGESGADIILYMAIEAANKFKNDEALSSAYFNLAKFYSSEEKYILASTFAEKHIKLALDKKNHNDDDSYEWINDTIFLGLETTKEAIPYLEKVIKYKQDISDFRGVIETELTLAKAYRSANKFTTSLKIYKSILSNPYAEPFHIFKSYIELSSINLELDKPSLSLEYLVKAELLDLESFDLRESIYINRLKAYIKLHYTDKADELFENIVSESYFKISNLRKENITDFYKIAAQYYKQKGDYLSAYNYFEKYHANSIEFESRKSDRVSEELRIKVSIEDKEKSIRDLEYKNVVNELNLAAKEKETTYQKLLIALSLILIIIITVILFKQTKSKRELSKLVNIDTLTKVSNRHFILRKGNKIMDKRKDQANGTSVIMMDIDNFKNINDTFGHTMGDQVLIEVAKLGKIATRDKDWFGRLGGEEFVVILPDTDEKTALIVAERVRHNIEEHNWKSIELESKITVSVGISSLDSMSEANQHVTFHDLLNFADKAMYAAKESGKNRVIPYSSII